MNDGQGRVTPPVIVLGETVDVFATIKDAELYLEPWAITEEVTVAYDPEGRLLLLKVVKEQRPLNVPERALGRRASTVEVVEIASGEDEPGHAQQVHVTPTDLLEAYAGDEPQTLRELPLPRP